MDEKQLSLKIIEGLEDFIFQAELKDWTLVEKKVIRDSVKILLEKKGRKIGFTCPDSSPEVGQHFRLSFFSYGKGLNMNAEYSNFVSRVERSSTVDGKILALSSGLVLPEELAEIFIGCSTVISLAISSLEDL
jgi:hypothetical protein